MNNNHPGDASMLRDPRTEANLKQLEVEERRRSGLAEQTSASNTPEARIRIWERRHHLTMPRNPEHNLINVIVQGTALTRAQVLEELRLRAEASVTPSA